MTEAALPPGYLGAVTEAPLTRETADRPSRHGQLLGQVLAELARIGGEQLSGMPEACLTCAFRPGSLPNQMASTGITALNCVLGVDKDRFACHHGMKEGEPTKLCAGYVAATLAPFEAVKAAMEWLCAALASIEEDDETRQAFDAWARRIDPDETLDAYQLARVYARDHGPSRP